MSTIKTGRKAAPKESSLYKDELPDLKADFFLANAPFNVSDWGANGCGRTTANRSRKR